MHEDWFYTIRYEFYFGDGPPAKEFNVRLDRKTISFVLEQQKTLPDWTKLDYKKCVCCPFTVEEHERCPVAANIAHLVEEFKESQSIEECLIRCITPDRTYEKKTSVQEGLYSVFGIVMATSDCPVMDFLKPMARFHLPFSTIQETLVRTTSIFLLREFFHHKAGRAPDLDMKKLDAKYSNVREVSIGILERIRSVSRQDAGENALAALYTISQMLSAEIKANLDSIEYLFLGK